MGATTIKPEKFAFAAGCSYNQDDHGDSVEGVNDDTQTVAQHLARSLRKHDCGIHPLRRGARQADVCHSP
jgi:hypothetical protein